MTSIPTSTDANTFIVDDVYDMIMASIEPELMSENIESLDEWYQNETEQENKERLERYKRAFTECNKIWSQFTVRWDSALQTQAMRAGKILEKIPTPDDV